MLYATKEMIDNRVGTLVAAADTVEEFTGFLEAIKGQEENRNWNELYASNFMDHMQNAFYKGFKHSVLAVYHDDEAQRDAFWTEWSLEERQSNTLRDRHLDMLHAKREQIREETETPEQKAMTIEERHGLDKNDPWDRRTEEEVEADNKQKQAMKDMQKKGEISGDSFGGADAQRAARPTTENVPGAYGRTQAIDALKAFDDQTDFEGKTNEELKEALEGMGVPDIQGVYDDGQVPQRTVEKKGNLYVEDIKGDRNEDGTFNIDSITAHKVGGEVDEVLKAERQADYEEKASEAKAGKRVFSPEDYAKILRGDGSADAIVNVEGDDRMGRGRGMSRPTLSDHAEAAIAEHKENERKEMKRRRTQAEKEADVKARGERDRGIFKGADLHPDDMDEVLWDELPENVRKVLEEADLKRDAIEVKNYPFNAELGGRAMLPFDGLSTQSGMRYVGGVNLTTEGTMTMGAPGVAIVSRTDPKEDGYGIYGRRKMVTVKSEVEGEEPTQESQVGVWLVRIRAN